MKIFGNHGVYYLSLIGILILGFIFVYVSSPNRSYQMLGIIITAFCYALWGILHHMLNHNLRGKIVLEYILISALGVSLAFLILKGGFGL